MVYVDVSVGNDTSQTQKNSPKIPWLLLQVEMCLFNAPPSCSLGVAWARRHSSSLSVGSHLSHHWFQASLILPPSLASWLSRKTEQACTRFLWLYSISRSTSAMASQEPTRQPIYFHELVLEADWGRIHLDQPQKSCGPAPPREEGERGSGCEWGKKVVTALEGGLGTIYPVREDRKFPGGLLQG